MTPAQKRAARTARTNAQFRAKHAGVIGSRVRNAGPDLTVGEEWDTSDGFHVRQVDARPNPYEQGHFFGTLQVLDFAEGRK